MIDFIQSFISRWIGSIVETGVLFVALLCCAFLLNYFWVKKIRPSEAALLFIFSAFVILNLPIGLAIDDYPLSQQIQIIFVLLSLLIFSCALYFWLERRNNRLALLFMVFGCVLATVGVVAVYTSSYFQDLCLPFSMSMYVVVGCAIISCAFLLAQRRLFNQVTIDDWRYAHPNHFGVRIYCGADIGAYLLIIFMSVAVYWVGMLTPQAMVGDEITHFYMLKTQSENLSKPNFWAHIPNVAGIDEVRRYPHSFVWHYIGAVAYHLGGQKFGVVQLYHSLFLFQFLLIGFLLARSRNDTGSLAPLMYILVLSSLPMCVIFSVIFYQGIPMAAQVLTAFYFLEKRKWYLASFFIAFAVGIKVTAVIFYPAFFVLLLLKLYKVETPQKVFVNTVLSLCIVMGLTWMLGKAINVYGDAPFYPQERLVTAIKSAGRYASRHIDNLVSTDRHNNIPVSRIGSTNQSFQNDPNAVRSNKEIDSNKVEHTIQETHPTIIANHPGDLRNKENYFVYGGILFWAVLCVGVFLHLPLLSRVIHTASGQTSTWLWFVGLSYMISVGFLTKTNPDARFFLAGMPFILLPSIEKIAKLPIAKHLIVVIAAVATLQVNLVLAKVSSLREIPREIEDAIVFLENHTSNIDVILMYPEGNYRFFPARHEWYLGYRLREFWRGNNDKRIEMLNYFGIDAIVIKHHLIAPVDEHINNLGVYPDYFVNEIAVDSRFQKVYSNSKVSIYEVTTKE